MAETLTAGPPLNFFPMDAIRDKQQAALEFAQRALDRGFRDILIAAPTGLGKSGIGSALCFWAAQAAFQLRLKPDTQAGGYYLVTQKLLQDQLADDVRNYNPRLRDSHTLKSATEYRCVQYGDCMTGRRMEKEKMCGQLKDRTCPYMQARTAFARAQMSVTNYPYFFAERSFVQALKPRKILIADECHSLEDQILGFVELLINEETVKKYTPMLELPRLKTLKSFSQWVADEFIPPLQNRVTMLTEKIRVTEGGTRQDQRELHMLENYVSRSINAMNEIVRHPDNWVYWQETDKKGNLISSAKPIDAAPFVPELLLDAAEVRVYMSAYPGPKHTFCKSLGLDPDQVASASYGSTFDPERRPVHLTFIGSMSRANIETTQPSMLRQIARIAKVHATEKGVIHTHSYKLGKAVYDYLVQAGLTDRVLFPDNSRDRTDAWELHSTSTTPSILISPSMTEGFNMIDDLARWQIIAKVPFPYLGDEQVKAKKARNPEWYVLQTCMTIIQACGRVMRSHEDHGVTYILDLDFKRLYTQNKHFFPKWFTSAFKWYD